MNSTGSDNTNVKDIKSDIEQGEDGNINDEKSSFWELITDVAKDLDLALQDLSPDLEISNKINHGIANENVTDGHPPSTSTTQSCDSLLFKSTDYRVAGDDVNQNDNNPIQENSFHFQTNNKEFKEMPAASMPSTSFASSSSNNNNKTSYSSQLLMALGSSDINSNSKSNSNLSNRIESPFTCSSPEPKSSSIRDGSGEEENSNESTESIASIGLLELFMRTYPIWFLPEIGRAGVVHLLQGKESGCFIVRQSSKANTMALSVRLPEGRGPHVEHYLIEDAGNGKLHLEGSENYFTTVPMLVCHYSQCCDELPVQLTLPKVLSQSNRQQLSSLSLLGQDFWQSSLSKTLISYDSNSNLGSPNSIPSQMSNQNNHLNLPDNSTCKSSPPPPPVPPKQDISDLDPIIDTKKSSTVQMNVNSHQNSTPKLPPRTTEPPPIPPRTLLNKKNNASANILNSSPPVIANIKTNSTSNHNPTINCTISNNISLIETSMNNHHENAAQSMSSSTSSQIDEIEIKNPDETSSIVCYRSCLDDKASDYEDIWGGTSSSKLTLDSTLNQVEEEILQINNNERGTQTNQTLDERITRQTSSPFYMDPIDVIKTKTSSQRRSDTDLNSCDVYTRPCFSGHSLESLIDTMKFSSAHKDTCVHLFNTKNIHLRDVCIQVGNSCSVSLKQAREVSWPVDSTWEWLNNCDISFENWRKHLLGENVRSSYVESLKSDATTIQDLILLKNPQLNVLRINDFNDLCLQSSSNDDNLLNYDNLAIYRGNQNETNISSNQNHSATQATQISQSEFLNNLFKNVFPKNSFLQLSPEEESKENTINSLASFFRKRDFAESTLTSLSESRRSSSTIDITEVSSLSDAQSLASENIEPESSNISGRETIIERDENFIESKICNYVITLALEGNNMFSKAINNFIQCTIESSENNPSIVMRNIRQFMNGMKNYLVKHGEGQFKKIVQEERNKLKPDEFLNIDAILEEVLHKLVIKPLKNYLYQLFVNEYNKNGSLNLLSNNIKKALKKSPAEIGIRSELQPPDAESMMIVYRNLNHLQKAYSPLRKLGYLLNATSAIYNSVKQQQLKKSQDSKCKSEHASFGADDFLPIFIYVLVQCRMISAEIEAEYIHGLIHPNLLTGEGGYYLTTLSSAVHVLKNMNDDFDEINLNNIITSPNNNTTHLSSDQTNLSTDNASVGTSQSSFFHSQNQNLQTLIDSQGYMKIKIPDVLTCSIISKTLPVRPNMTTKEACKMIAHKFKITNPEDYGLFKLINGEEIQLNDNELPQIVKSESTSTGIDCQFAYKRCDAKFIWPSKT